MSKFSISAVERLDYDFTGFKRDDGEGYCTGKGTIPEPSQKDLEEYFEGMRELMGGEDSLEELANQENADEQLEQLLGIIAKLCKNSPSVEELNQLPPRIKIAFIRYVQKELSDPEVSSAGTRR